MRRGEKEEGEFREEIGSQMCSEKKVSTASGGNSCSGKRENEGELGEGKT